MRLLNSSWHCAEVVADQSHRIGSGSDRPPAKDQGRTREVSAGGLVMYDDRVLLLQDADGAWVLPKGKLKSHEAPRDAARREVHEESGVSASIVSDLGTTAYMRRLGDQQADKTVHWFLMRTATMKTVPSPQFAAAAWVPTGEALERLRWREEQELVSSVRDWRLPPET